MIKNINKKVMLNNIVAGIIVGIIALPLAMAFAIASGVKPEQGIYTSIVAGIIVALWGGSKVQVSGPTGAFVVILASITAEHGIVGLQIATIMAGFILILMSVFKLGQSIKFIPYPVVVGFTSGIGVIIFVNAWKDFFGLPITLAIDLDFHARFIALIANIPLLDPWTTFISITSLAILVIVPRLQHLVPGSVIVLIYGTVLQAWFSFPGVATIGSVFGHLPQKLPVPSIPLFSISSLIMLLQPALLIAFLGSIESLLSATAADSMTNKKHHANKELFGQGLANVITPLFGGFASTGAIARTVANIRHGGTMPLAAIVHSVTLILILVLFAPYAEHIPFACLAAILFMVAYNMSDIPEFFHLVRHAPRTDIIVLLSTFFLTIFTNLITAVAVGVIVAMLFFMSRIYKLTVVTKEQSVEGFKKFGDDTIVYIIDGPFYFGVAEKIEHALAVMHLDFKNVIFRLHKVTMIDMTGLEIFSKITEEYHKRGVKIFLCEANPTIIAKMTKIGILKLIESKRVYPSIQDIPI